MLKFALAAGIVYEWLFGATVFTLPSLEYAALRTVCATLLAWMILESGRVLLMAALSLDGRPPARRRG
jgi:hypothetical protein